jgi:O-antigen/teichoic acid export membrane protein
VTTSLLRHGQPAAAPDWPPPGLEEHHLVTMSGPRLPVTWPLVAAFVAFPVWWALGVSAFVWPVLAAPMLVAMIWRRRTRAPVAFALWLLFSSWVLLSGLQLDSGSKIMTFAYRLALYAGAGILFLYVYNLPRSGRLDVKVLRILTVFWMIVVAGGYAGILLGSHTFTPPFEHLLPHGLRNQPFVQELVQPVFAEVDHFLGYPVPRPAAPFTYTNEWGGTIAVLTPVAFAAIAAAGRGPRRRMLLAVLVASLVPIVISLNRGMFLSLGLGILYVAIRLAMRGRVGALASLVGVLVLMALVVALTPLGHLVVANVSSTHGHSNANRLSVSQEAVKGANQSPIFGHGEPQAVTGPYATPAIGTQGQLWMLLYSNGYPATVLFIGFYIAVLWQTRRARGVAGIWLHAVPLIALAQIFVYGWLPVELQVVMVIAALTYRRCWLPPRQPAAASPAPAMAVPAPVRASPAPVRASPAPLVGAGQGFADVTRSLPMSGPRPGARVPAIQAQTIRVAGKVPAQTARVAGEVPAETVRVARGSVVNLVAMVTGAALSFGLTVVVSRWLQPSGAGALFELIALFTIMSQTFELGADTGLTRWISRARAIGGLADVRTVLTVALLPVLVVGTFAAVATWLAAPELAHVFLHGMAARVGAADIRIIAPLVPLGALSFCLVDAARGFGRMWPYLAIEGLGKPVARMGLVLAAVVLGLGLHGALVAWGAPVAIGLVAAWLIFARILRTEVPAGAPGSAGARHQARPEHRSGPAVRTARGHRDGERGRHHAAVSLAAERVRRLAGEFWRFTGPRGLQATFQVVILWLDILLVGAVVSRYAAGVYAAVSKLAIVGTFALEGNRLAIGPQLSVFLARRQHDRAAELYQSATRWLILASWPLYLVFAIFPAVVLGIFGARYTAGAEALAVLSLAMLVNLGTGNVTVVLLMGGKSSWSAFNATAALIVNVGLNLLLLPHIGILGAAIAWGASIVVDNVTAMVEIRWVLGLAPFGPGYLLVAAATVGCFGVTGIAVRMLLGQTLPALAAAVAAGLAAYGTVLYLARAPLQLTGISAVLRRRALPAGRGPGPKQAEA